MDTLSLATRVKDRRPVYYLPLTLKDLKFVTSTEDENFKLFGVSVELVEVVCLITGWQQTTMKIVLELTDHTSKFIGAVYTRNDEKTPTSLREYTRDPHYASVFGRIMKFADQPMISILKMRNVEYPEVLAHRARALHLVVSMAKAVKALGNEEVQMAIVGMLGGSGGVPVSVLGEKLRLPQDALRAELFSLIERGKVTMKNNRVYKL